jgi:hypothetical protein
MNFTSARTSILKIASTLIAAAALSTSALHAQTPTRLAVVTVPFAFESGSAHLPAGTYTFSVVGAGLMTISGDSTGTSMSLIRRNPDAQNSGETKVVFHHYGNQYFLREVWGEGAPSHVVAIESKAEATARKAPKSLTVAGVAPAAVQVTIAAH